MNRKTPPHMPMGNETCDTDIHQNGEAFDIKTDIYADNWYLCFPSCECLTINCMKYRCLLNSHLAEVYWRDSLLGGKH